MTHLIRHALASRSDVMATTRPEFRGGKLPLVVFRRVPHQNPRGLLLAASVNELSLLVDAKVHMYHAIAITVVDPRFGIQVGGRNVHCGIVSGVYAG